MPFILSNDLTKIFNFSNLIPEYDSHNLGLLNLLRLFDSGTYFWVACPQLEIYDHVVVSVSIEFKEGYYLYRTTFGNFSANWFGILNHLRKDIFELHLSLAASGAKFRLELMYISLLINIWLNLTNIHGFQLFVPMA